MLSVVCTIVLSGSHLVVQGGAGVATPFALVPWYGGRFSSAWRNNTVFFLSVFRCVCCTVSIVFFSSKRGSRRVPEHARISSVRWSGVTVFLVSY